MQIRDMGQAFVEGRERRGLGMRVRVDDQTTLEYSGGAKIATISDRTAHGFTLTLHQNNGFNGYYGMIAHCNRLSAIFRAISSERRKSRYTAFKQWGSMYIFDIRLQLRLYFASDLNFIVRNNVVVLDYQGLEKTLMADEQPETATNNESINNLMALVATI